MGETSKFAIKFQECIYKVFLSIKELSFKRTFYEKKWRYEDMRAESSRIEYQYSLDEKLES